MATISCTKKLFEVSGFVEEHDPKEEDELYKWHAHYFRLAKKNNMILMNNRTRYSITLIGLKKEHYKAFPALFKEALISNFRAEKVPESFIRDYETKLNEIRFAKTYDRSVIGSITDMIKMNDFRFDHYPNLEMNIIDLNKENNRTPVLKLKEVFPIEALRVAYQN